MKNRSHQRCRLLVPLLVLSLITPWGLLQSFAWMSMFARFSRETSFGQALAMTFDGKHPCRLCHLVQQGQASERQHHPVPEPLQKLELALPPPNSIFPHSAIAAAPACGDLDCPTRSEPPPGPPPRLI